MKVEKVNYQKAYVIGPYLQEKIGFEVSLDEGDSPEEAITAMKELADKWHEENDPLLNLDTGYGPAQFAPPSTTPVIQTERPNNPQWTLENDINSCTEIKVLETYKLLIKNNTYLQAVYEKKFAELKK